MATLWNELILTESKQDFFETLSRFYHQKTDEPFLMALPEGKQKDSLVKLYHLMFHDAEDMASYQSLLLKGLLEKSYVYEKDALVIYDLLKKEAGRFFQLAVIRQSRVSNIWQVCLQFERMMPQLLWMMKDEQAILIFTFDHGPFVNEAMKQTMISILEGYQCTMYLSYPYDRFVDSAEFYRQTTLFADIETAYQGPMVEFETAYLNTLFAASHHRQFLSSLIHPNIKRAIEHDKKYHTPYYETLKTYFECRRDIKKTSEALGINKSTLFYRFKQIGKMLDQDFYDLDLFAFEFSIRINEFLKK